MGKILSIVDTAYRATLEEQDDTSLWFNHACINSGAKIDVLLQGNAVNYLVAGHNPPKLNFGNASISHPSLFDKDLESMRESGAKLYYMIDDVELRGISQDQLIGGIEGVKREQLSSLVLGYDHVWNW